MDPEEDSGQLDRKRDHYIHPNTETGSSSINFSLDSARSEERWEWNTGGYREEELNTLAPSLQHRTDSPSEPVEWWSP